MKRLRMTPLLRRLVSAVLTLGTGAVLAIALYLRPAVEVGHSTHTQLGLGECSFLTLTDYPCPMCGMTTTFSLMAHLRPLEAIVTQPFGVVLFLLTVAVFSVSLAETVQPRERWGRILKRLGPYEGALAILFLIGLGAGWIYKIAIMRWLV